MWKNKDDKGIFPMLVLMFSWLDFNSQLRLWRRPSSNIENDLFQQMMMLTSLMVTLEGLYI